MIESPPTNYYLLSQICLTISQLLKNNIEGVNYLLSFPLLVQSLLLTLKSATLISITSSCTPDIIRIQNGICVCFFRCALFSFEHSANIVKFGIIDVVIKLLETHINEIKTKGKKLDDSVLESASSILFNITHSGFFGAFGEERNKFKKSFHEIDGIKRMYELFSFLNALKSEEERTEDEKNTVKFIAISICFLFKSDTMPVSYFDLIIYLHNLKLSSPPLSWANIPRYCRIAWNGMVFYCFFFFMFVFGD
jgi:hypothetical protein